jgi:hypothetical protein
MLSKTMKITTQRYYDFVCFLYVYENLSITLGVKQRLRGDNTGIEKNFMIYTLTKYSDDQNK